ncbi:hypothetical protein KEM48_006840 [Puccinia striiformis f. sp. tritici PST-130]|nr:hypothetical protein KEM48_006840 [Puccinia striiformis f. sp. tritici PST-130]
MDAQADFPYGGHPNGDEQQQTQTGFSLLPYWTSAVGVQLTGLTHLSSNTHSETQLVVVPVVQPPRQWYYHFEQTARLSTSSSGL